MDKDLIAKVSTDIHAPREKVWHALTDPASIKQYMFGADVQSDWQKGSPIVWKGEWKGKPFEDRGEVLDARPGEHLEYRHQHHRVTIDLAGEGGRTQLSLSQDGNPDEKARAQSEKNWGTMLASLKKLLDKA